MNRSQHDLLQPTLDAEAPISVAPYSIQTTFFTGFFGGPFAALAIIGVNSFRLRRLSRDIALLLILAIGVTAVMWVLYASEAGAPARAWLEGALGNSNRRLVTRLAALLLVGAGYLLHRREQRNADLFALKRPNGWIGGLICCLTGGLLFAILLASFVKPA